MAAEQQQGTWSPTDFMIQGAFCPIEEIEPALERARRQVGARAAFLLVGDNWVILKSLCACVPVGDPQVEGLRKLLTDASLLRHEAGERARSRALQDFIRGPRHAQATKRRFPITADKALDALEEIALKHGDKTVAAWMAEGVDSWVPANLPSSVSGARIQTALFFYKPRSRVEELRVPKEIPRKAPKPKKGKREYDVFRVVASDEAVVEISTKVNATAHANVRRDNTIMKRLDQKLDPADYIAGSVDFQAAAQALVDVVIEISGSDAGACYLVEPSRKRYRREAVRLNGEFGKRWAYPPELSSKYESLGAAAAEEHLALQLPPGLVGYELAPTIEALGEQRGDLLELATPLPGPLAAPKAPAVGVLSVAKLEGGTPYGAYEIAVVRNVALRLALISSTINTTQAAEMFARLSMRAARLAAESGSQRKRWSTPATVVLPDDIYDALPPIDDALKTLVGVTRASSATFRAALPCEETDTSHGSTLARVAGYPVLMGRGEKHAFQPESAGGYNWRAVRTGEISNVPVVERGDKTFTRHRRGTKSELAVPVYVEDRVVGVVNLESSVKHAFDAHIEIAQAAAEHIGLAIANARLALSVLVQERATDVLHEAHRISKEPKNLQTAFAGLPAPKRERLKADVEDVLERVDKLASVAPQKPRLRAKDLSLPGLVAAGLRRSKLRGVEVEQEDRLWRPHEKNVALVITKALEDILENARGHRAEKAPPPTIELVGLEWGGQAQDVLIVKSVPAEPHDPEEAINIYRCPLEMSFKSGGGRPEGAHLGAYLAGLQIRRVGGEVHLSYLKGPLARVVLAVPSPPPARRAASRKTRKGKK